MSRAAARETITVIDIDAVHLCAARPNIFIVVSRHVRLVEINITARRTGPSSDSAYVWFLICCSPDHPPITGFVDFTCGSLIRTDRSTLRKEYQGRVPDLMHRIECSPGSRLHCAIAFCALAKAAPASQHSNFPPSAQSVSSATHPVILQQNTCTRASYLAELLAWTKTLI